MIEVSHFVGLSGVGGVQRNFVEYINHQDLLNSRFKHKIYTLGKVDLQYQLPIEIFDIRNIINLFSLIKDVISRRKVVHFYNNLASIKVFIFLFFIPVCNLVLHERGTIWNSPSSRGKLLQFIAWKSSLIIANSSATKTMLEKKFYVSSKKIRVLHNGINTTIKCKKRSRYSYAQTFRVGFIGRLDTPKGVHILIDAMRYLTKYNIQLVIAGDGPLRGVLKNQACSLKSISFVGRVEEPYNFLSMLDLLVVPSIREPLGNVCLEAGLCKVPVLAANVDGLPEIIKDKTSGELISPSKKISFETVNTAIPLPEFVVNPTTQKLESPKQIDPLLLSHKILNLYNAPDTLVEYGEQLHNRVVEYFNIDRYTHDLHNIYFEVSK